VPLLSLSFDEHSGEAGLTTRLEAFADLLARRAWRRARNPDRRA
jgi:predicted nucleotide-binding protein (sugar kinase/HSP70/actin superfamily)